MATVEESLPAAATTTRSPVDRQAQMYPILSDAQIETLRPAAREKSFSKGECLWDVGTRNVDFYVVLHGDLEIVQRNAFGNDTVLVVHQRGSYAGETTLLSGRAAMVAGRAGTDLQVLAVPVDRIRGIMVTNAALSELIMRSFILRRVRMISEGVSDLLLIGSRHSADTLRLQEFLTRNAHPYTFFDLESASDVCATLSRFDVRPEETPIIITSKGEPLRNPSLRELAGRLGLSLSLDLQAVHDVAVIGAGPAGLAAAVYAASEGLDVIVVDPVAPGGQAGTSSKIENYLGFPTGIYYGATYLESQFCREQEIAIIGGGNSAGQAAVFLADSASKVYILVRSEGLAASMSQYLIRRIETTDNIELIPWSEIIELEGRDYLEGVRWRHRKSGEETARQVKHLFVFIGAAPNTEFLPDSVMTDANGFVCTGPDIFQPEMQSRWPAVRPPFPLETSCPGVFAAGDVRANSTKRVASAVGEGSVVVQYVHRLLA